MAASFSPPPSIPQINIDSFPAEEREEARHLAAILHLLDAYVLRFEDALDLIALTKRMQEDIVATINKDGITDELVAELGQPFRWHLIAGRDASLSIYHFERTLNAISRSIHSCSSLNALLGKRPLDPIKAMFSNQFPDAENMRHAVGHSAEMAETIKHLQSNALAGRYPSRMEPQFAIADAIGTRLSDDRMMLSHKGKNVYLDMNQKSLACLYDILRALCRLFAPVSVSQDASA